MDVRSAKKTSMNTLQTWTKKKTAMTYLLHEDTCINEV